MRAATRSHIIDAQTAYHFLSGRPWIHWHKVVLYTYHQCLKAILNGKRVRINVLRIPFSTKWSSFLRSCLFRLKLRIERKLQVDIKACLCQHGRTSRDRSTCLTVLPLLPPVILNLQNSKELMTWRDVVEGMILRDDPFDGRMNSLHRMTVYGVRSFFGVWAP